MNKQKIKEKAFFFLFIFLIALSILTCFKTLPAIINMVAHASPMQPNNNTIGYEIINGSVAHLWNYIYTCDRYYNECGDIGNDYYINLTNGLQITNHQDQYWTHNLWCGMINRTGTWQEYCTDTLPFYWRVASDNLTYASVQGNRTVGIATGTRINIIFTYNLSVNGTNITITPTIQNTGTRNINYPIGVKWTLKDIRINMSYNDNWLMTLENASGTPTYRLLNNTWDFKTKNLVEGYIVLLKNKTLMTPVILSADFNNQSNVTLTVKSQAGQYNAPVSLSFTRGSLPIGASFKNPIDWIDWEDHSALCTPRVTVSLVSISIDANGTALNPMKQSFSDSERFNYTVSWTRGSITDGVCNAFLDIDPTPDYLQWTAISDTYVSSVLGRNASNVKAINWFRFFQGMNIDDNIRYSVECLCGYTHTYTTSTKAHLRVFVGGKKAYMNFTCIDNKKPYLSNATISTPKNNSIYPYTNITIYINVSDDTNLRAIELWENWTSALGTFKLNQSLSITGLNYFKSWNPSFILPDGNYSFYLKINDTNTANQNTTGRYKFVIDRYPNCSFVSPTDNDWTNITNRNFTLINISCDKRFSNLLINFNSTIYNTTHNTTTGHANISVFVNTSNTTYWYRGIVNTSLNTTINNEPDDYHITFVGIPIAVLLSVLLLFVIITIIVILSFIYNVNGVVAILWISSMCFVYLGLSIYLQGIGCGIHLLCFEDRNVIEPLSTEAFVIFIVLVFGSIINIITATGWIKGDKKQRQKSIYIR